MSPDQDTTASGLQRISEASPVRVIAVASGKGGVGKSNVAVNLSVALAQAGRSTLLLDADLGLANVDVLLGLTRSQSRPGHAPASWPWRRSSSMARRA